MARKWQVFLVVGVGVLMASLDLFIVNIAFPAIRADFGGTSLESLSWILAAYAIVFAALLVPAGRWADHLGRRRAFLLGIAVFTAASAACAAAPSPAVLVAARVVQAAGAALLLPTSLGLLLPEFGPREQHVAIGAWAAISGVAAASGPPLGGLLVQANWRWVFLVNVPVGVVTLIAGRRLLREVRHPEAVPPDAIGAGLLAAGVGALTVAIVQGSAWGWASARIAGLFALAAVLLAGLAVRCARHPAPIIEPALVRVRAFALATTGSLLFFVGFAAMLLGSVLFLMGTWHEDVLTAGLMLAPGPATAALCSVPGARLGARIGQGAAGTAGGALFALGGALWLARLGAEHRYMTDFLPGMMIGGAGVGLFNPSVTGAAAGALPPARLATGIAVLTTGRQIGSALGVAIVVAVLGSSTGATAFGGVWAVMVVAGATAGVAMAMVRPVRARARAEAAAATA